MSKLEKARELIDFCKENVDFYKKSLKKINVNEIKTYNDLQKLPFTTKDDVKRTFPYGFLGAPLSDIVEYSESSGTSSNDFNRSSRMASFSTQKDIERDIERRVSGDLRFTETDIIFNALPYALTTSGHHFQMAAQKASAMVISADNGSLLSNYRKQLDLIRRLNPTIIITSYPFVYSTLMIMLGISSEELTNLRAVQLCGMSTSQNGKKKISKLFNSVPVFDTYGMSEFGAIAATCHCGNNHVCDDFIVEVINPRTLEPLDENTGGEIVITSLSRQGSPKIRYRTGDVGKIKRSNCPCGRIQDIIEITGRLKDIIIIEDKRFTLNDFENVFYQHATSTGMYVYEKDGNSGKITIDCMNGDLPQTAKEIKMMIFEALQVKIEVECVSVGLARKDFFQQNNSNSLKSLQSVGDGEGEQEWLVTY